MKYQLIRHFKTVSRVLTVYDTLEDCHKFASQESVVFTGLNYIGNFPIFNDNRGWVYSIQGLVDGLNIVCSLPKGEAESFQKYANK